ncbi:C80 family cysteine peptidase [Moellerella wisconsensis]|uniref:C80 family cysteine peptidase n=1 Tax=Moellerella wisconsensis TaxID=158849 RepID=UPI0030760231
MPVNNKSVKQIGFNQSDAIMYIQANNQSAYVKKLMTEHGQNKAAHPGFCFGFSASYLLYAANGQGEEYLKLLGDLYTITHKKDVYFGDLYRIREEAKEIHAKSLFVKLINEVVSIQTNHVNTVKMANYYRYIDNSENIMITHDDFEKHLVTVLDKYQSMHSDEGDLLYKSFIEQMKVSLKKYYPALLAKKDSDLTNEGRELRLDPLLIELQTHFGERLSSLEKNFTMEDTKTFLKVLIIDTQKEIVNRMISSNKTNGIIFDSKEHPHQISNDYEIRVKLSEFTRKIASYTNKEKPLLYQFLSDEHVMAIKVDYNKGLWKYSFFDPNTGLKNFSSKKNFISYIKDVVKSNSENYGFPDLGNGDYLVYYSSYELDTKISTRKKLTQLNELDIKITENTLLAERKIKVNLNGDKTKILTYESFNPETKIAQLTLTLDNKKTTIYTDILDSVDFKSSIQANLETLKKTKNKIFISKNDALVYNVNKKSLINKIDPTNTSQLFGKPVAQLDKGFSDIYQADLSSHHPGSFAGEHTPSTENINNWHNPLDYIDAVNTSLQMTKRVLNPTEYAHNVFIQIAGDHGSALGTAKAMLKHPDNSTVIQYDIPTKQWKVLQGALDTPVVGKIRWVVIGHGNRTGKKTPTLFQGNTALEFVEGIKHLNTTLLSNYEPNKMVLLGCHLARGGIVENFALKAAQLFSQQGMEIPLVAYNRKVGIDVSGNKFFWHHDSSDITTQTKEHKYIYQYDKVSGQVSINNKPAALHFIDELRHGEIKLWQLVGADETNSLKLLKNSNNQLDFDLIKKVAFHNEGYKKFLQVIMQTQFSTAQELQQQLLTLLEPLNIEHIPLWRMIDPQPLSDGNQAVIATDNKKLYLVIRTGDGDISRSQAERVAAAFPENTLVIQLNTNNQQMMVEYGDVHKLALLPEQQWLLLQNSSSAENSAQLMADSLKKLQQHYLLSNPEKIVFAPITEKSSPANIDQGPFTQQLAELLEQKGFNTPIEVQHIVDSPPDLAVDEHGKVQDNQTPHQQVDSLLKKLALDDILPSKMTLESHPYLKHYFTDAEGQLDNHKLQVAFNDPLLSSRIHQFLNQNIDDAGLAQSRWDALFAVDTAGTLQQHAADITKIITAISDNPGILPVFSETSIQRLSLLFPANNGVNHGDIIDLINHPKKLSLFKHNLATFAELSADNFTGEQGALKNLTLFQALEKHAVSLGARLNDFSQLVNIAKKYAPGSQIRLINHGIYQKTGATPHSDHQLGVFYSMLRQGASPDYTLAYLERMTQLEQQQRRGTLSTTENDLLTKMQQLNLSATTHLDKLSITIENQSIHHQLLAMTRNSTLLLKGKSTTYTVSYHSQYGKDDLSFFDPSGVELRLNIHQQGASEYKFAEMVMSYLNEEIEQADKSRISRGKLAGFDMDENKDFRTDIQQVDHHRFDDEYFKLIDPFLDKSDLIITHAHFDEPQNRFIDFHNEKISLHTLQHLGATIAGNPLTGDNIYTVDGLKNIRFNAGKLAAALTLMDGSEQDITLLKIIRKQIDDLGISRIVDNYADFIDSAVIGKQLSYIQKNIEVDSVTVSATTLEHLRSSGIKLPRYSRIANRAGQVMGGIGAIMSLISLATQLKRLDNPDITPEELAEVEKNIYLTCASAFFNYGDMILQPMLLELAYAKTGSFNVASTIAAKVVILFNLVGIGLDIYQAYDALSKLDGVTDVKTRQDLFVSAGLSIGSAVVGGLTVVGILAGSAVIPVVGLVIGGVLLVGGMIYNGVRAVERITDEINISLERQIEEGFRGMLGFDPTLRSQQEMSLKRYSEGSQKAYWEHELAYFKTAIYPSGFVSHLSVIETPRLIDAPRYYLIDKLGNYFGGKLGRHATPSHGVQIGYTKHEAPTFSQQEADLLLADYHLWGDGNARLTLAVDKDCDHKFTKLKKDLIDYQWVGGQESDDILVLNSAYNNPLLTEFMQRQGLSQSQLEQPIERQLASSKALAWNMFSLRDKYATDLDPNLSMDQILRHYFKQIKNDIPNVARYLTNQRLKGLSINTATGNDVVIGKMNEINAVQVFAGQKFVVGGNQNDYFYLRDHSLISLSARGENRPTKYFDGQGGSDSLIINERPEAYSVEVDLGNNRVIYHSENREKSLDAAHIQHIENIIIRGNSDDIVRGNEQNNVIDGSLGDDKLYGYNGDDKLILATGYANGGEGNDSYHLRRYEWHRQLNNFSRIEKRYDAKTKRFSEHKVINSQYRDLNSTEYMRQVVLDEDTLSESTVDLEYSLNEITEMSVNGTSLFITFNMPSSTIEGVDFSKVTSKLRLELKNVYINTGDGRKVRHRYMLRTRDGFLLTSQLGDLAKDNTANIDRDLFSITYLQNNDQLSVDPDKSIQFDGYLGKLTIDNKRTYTMPSWGKFNPIGQGMNVVYTGNDDNNQMSHLGAGNKIYVSHGQDIYQLNQAFDRGEIIFDFYRVKDCYTAKDTIVLMLPNENGYMLSMSGQTLRLIDAFGEQRLAIRFANFDDKIAEKVIIQDKYSNVFKVNLHPEGSYVTPLYSPNQSTEHGDVITLPQGYQDISGVIDGMEGNDVISDNSQQGRIIRGGAGNDIIKVLGGYNVIYGGQGNDFLYGGAQSDFLLSDDGDELLAGGGGDDHYLVDGRGKGTVEIDDDIGDNHIHLLNFTEGYTTEVLKNGALMHCYTSTTGRTVKIKQPTVSQLSEAKNAHNQVHHYAQLSEELSLLTEVNFAPLVDDLRDKSSQAKMSGEFASWKPVDSLQGALIGSKRSLLFNQLNNSVVLSHSHRRGDWLINTQEGNNTVVDHSGHGRVFKGGTGNDQLFTFGSGNNVLYGGAGDDQLVASTGKGNDLLISLDGRDLLNGGEGDDSYLVDGQGVGDVTIIDYWGKNRLHLINFKPGISGNVTQLSATQIEETYESYHGRKVFLRKSIDPVMNSVSLDYYSAMPANLTAAIKNSAENSAENTIDQLISNMVSLREAVEISHAAASEAEKKVWSPAAVFEHRMNAG